MYVYYVSPRPVTHLKSRKKNGTTVKAVVVHLGESNRCTNPCVFNIPMTFSYICECLAAILTIIWLTVNRNTVMIPYFADGSQPLKNVLCPELGRWGRLRCKSPCLEKIRTEQRDKLFSLLMGLSYHKIMPKNGINSKSSSYWWLESPPKNLRGRYS